MITITQEHVDRLVSEAMVYKWHDDRQKDLRVQTIKQVFKPLLGVEVAASVFESLFSFGEPSGGLTAAWLIGTRSYSPLDIIFGGEADMDYASDEEKEEINQAIHNSSFRVAMDGSQLGVVCDTPLLEGGNSYHCCPYYVPLVSTSILEEYGLDNLYEGFCLSYDFTNACWDEIVNDVCPYEERVA